MNGRHICILDDDIFWQDALVRRFVERGIRASLVEAESELWELLSTDPFQVAIVEPKRYENNTHDILRALNIRSIPVIVCTRMFHPTHISSFLQHKPSAFYLKGNVSSEIIIDHALRLLEKELVY